MRASVTFTRTSKRLAKLSFPRFAGTWATPGRFCSMSENRDQEARSFDDAEADGDRAVAELRESLDRLRGQVGWYRERFGDNDNTDDGERSEA